jgi:hypothetical protein
MVAVDYHQKFLSRLVEVQRSYEHHCSIPGYRALLSTISLSEWHTHILVGQ